jgi:hypothetical protein
LEGRSDEILFWLENHPQTSRYIVLDDSDAGYDGLPLCQPDPSEGLSSEITQAVVDYFEGRRLDDFVGTPLFV